MVVLDLLNRIIRRRPRTPFVKSLRRQTSLGRIFSPLRLEPLEDRIVLATVYVGSTVHSGWSYETLLAPGYWYGGFNGKVYGGDGSLQETGATIAGTNWTTKVGDAMLLDGTEVSANLIYNSRINKNRQIVEFDLSDLQGKAVESVILTLSDSGFKSVEDPDDSPFDDPPKPVLNNQILVSVYEADLESTADDYGRAAESVTTLETQAGRPDSDYSVDLTAKVKEFLDQGKTKLGVRFAAGTPGTFESFGTASGSGIQLEAKVLSAEIDVKHLEWNVANGGAEFRYEIKNADLPDDAKIQLFWADDNGVYGTIGNAVHEMFATKAVGTYDVFVPSGKLSAPPPGATQIVVIADVDNQINEDDEDNNTKWKAYNPSLTVNAKYDGNLDENIFGRYFTGVAISDQSFTVRLSDELTALRPTVELKVGTTKLTLTQQADKHEYKSTNFDVAKLTKDADVTVTVTLNKKTLTKTDGTPLHDKMKIDMEVVPKWMTIALKGLKKSFDTAAKEYLFEGALVDLSTSKLSKLAIPKTISFGGGYASGVDVHFDARVKASIDAAKEPEVTGHATASATFLGHSLASFDETLPSNGKFGVNIDLNNQTLAIDSGSFTFLDNGSKQLNLFENKAFKINKLALFDYTSHVVGNVTYDMDLKVVFKADGSIDAAQSRLNLTFNSQLSGSIDPHLADGAANVKKVLDVLQTANLPQLIFDAVKNALQSLGVVPTVDLTAAVAGNIDVSATVALSGKPSKITPAVKSFSGQVKLMPKVSAVLTWLGQSTTIDAPESWVDLLTVDAPFSKT